jgi:hypothetical protein
MNKTVAEKLGIKNGFQIYVANPQGNYINLIEAANIKMQFAEYPEKYSMDVVHLFCKSRNDLEKGILEHKNHIRKNGMIWVSWPKKASGIKTDINENIIRIMALEIGMVDVKVCSINHIWSGLKLVYRKMDR